MDSFGTELPATSSAPGLARGWLRETLQTWNLDGFGEVTELLTSELVSNVVNHVGEPMSIRIFRMADGIRVEVDDPSADEPTVYRAGEEDEHHRGMMIVASLANRWGSVVHGDDGKTVWFELDTETGHEEAHPSDGDR